ncbi:MAG: phosphoribosylformylglycinamidine cyclo-ligase [Candidatus Eisenbacteria bacterium]|uniref:Phosphoribosylformylglycinamidine cyclo-ligase n=1 Tax=Eiseniibacteriota bacterium TaxID=2212470 RepID=A0A9D6L8I0_UNCEI|nr:phosphoribosylformylglycinamidine cyclo-ligase [Candidatus Eisenbacteria bacterium]
MRYRDAGVDVARADRLKRGIGAAIRATWGPGVRPIPGGFAGVTTWPAADGALLAATMDGVGTKLHVAMAAGRVGDAAADLVYHCANDLLVHGARPLAFLDYVAQARLEPGVIEAVVAGLARACGDVGAALLGGETAEMPDTYVAGVVDVAGCMIGVADPRRLLDGSAVRPGDALLGLASAGLHTNGFSLARRVLETSGLTLDRPLPGGAGETVGEALLAPHRWYGPALTPVIAAGRVHALAHVTGGGIAGNVVRILPEGCHARVVARAWARPALVRWIVEAGAVPEDDAREALNLGIGMVLVSAREGKDALTRDLERAGERVFAIGEVVSGARGVTWTEGA